MCERRGVRSVHGRSGHEPSDFFATRAATSGFLPPVLAARASLHSSSRADRCCTTPSSSSTLRSLYTTSVCWRSISVCTALAMAAASIFIRRLSQDGDREMRCGDVVRRAGRVSSHAAGPSRDRPGSPHGEGARKLLATRAHHHLAQSLPRCAGTLQLNARRRRPCKDGPVCLARTSPSSLGAACCSLANLSFLPAPPPPPSLTTHQRQHLELAAASPRVRDGSGEQARLDHRPRARAERH